MATAVRDKRSLAELTQAFFGEALMVNQVFERLELEPWSAGRADDPAPRETAGEQLLWVGSIGYEHYRVNTDFAAQLSRMGVERLIDVRQLPISRRRGYAKTALGAALAAEGIEYVHMRGLGNPKPTRDLYKSGHTAEGRAGYEEYLLGEQRGAFGGTCRAAQSATLRADVRRARFLRLSPRRDLLRAAQRTRARAGRGRDRLIRSAD
jgi:hypothetical protein